MAIGNTATIASQFKNSGYPVQAQNVFMPVSLRTSLFSKSKLRTTLHLLASQDVNRVLCLVCDDLAALSKMSLGANDFSHERHKHQIIGGKLRRFITRIVEDHEDLNATVSQWCEIAAQNDFKHLLKRTTSFLESNAHFISFLEHECHFRSHQRNSGCYVDSEWERTYMLNEIAMSLYVTEILGYELEIYPGSDISFVAWMYENDPFLVKRIVEKSDPRRHFLNISPFVNLPPNSSGDGREDVQRRFRGPKGRRA